MGLTVTGTLGILLKAKQLALIRSFSESAAEMRAAGIFYNADLIRRLATSIGEYARASSNSLAIHSAQIWRTELSRRSPIPPPEASRALLLTRCIRSRVAVQP